ncbi:MAG: hypothetical protein JWM31_2135 [Solirubrobacterales bacterium]|nr:hypothetical protein [Solirubrobacterales bacterium]
MKSAGLPHPHLDEFDAQVLRVLRTGSRRLRLNEMAAATGLPVSRIATGLQTLERQGHVRFVAGRWVALEHRGRQR